MASTMTTAGIVDEIVAAWLRAMAPAALR